MSAAHLEKLNERQRAAVEHGVGLSEGVLDYDDFLLYWAQTISDATLADEIGGRWDHVLVDEYQDTDRLQAAQTRRCFMS